MPRFSERFGFEQMRSALQLDDIDQGLKNKLWNVIREEVFDTVPPFPGSYADNLSNQPVYNLFLNTWHDYFKKPMDEISPSYFHAVREVRNYFMKCPWYEVYNFLEFLVDCVSANKASELVAAFNTALKDEMSGYRFVSGRLAQITKDEEIEAVEKAQSLPDSLSPVNAHLKQALSLLSNRKNPDYRNSIKESILAIESLGKLISSKHNATLGPTLKALEKKIRFHPSLKDGFLKIYGYTSDADGIRHALLEESRLDQEDALFMLVSCSAFVNYLVAKAGKAGISV